MSYLLIGAADGLPGEPVAVLPDDARPRFDNATDTWSAISVDNRPVTAHLIVDARRTQCPMIALHGRPNWFAIGDPDNPVQLKTVSRLIELVERSGVGRIEARSKVRARRFYPGGLALRFYLSGTESVEDDVYDGPATLAVGDTELTARVRLTGHLHPVDGHFHWQGIVFDGQEIDRAGPVRLTIDGNTVEAKLTERTSQGVFMIVGAGAPPYALT
ncbi:DUF4873 domain-containing protein [Mycolicibacterium brumae]|uniref:DUF4873 domain-containing protein n=1 Tax=Mycolicibacterium brumae TaxID=85968 RepID=A0A2G5PFV3_9MYCO|nr:DUF4873 domain-containing protein [Mycolicibacterium brumae]MCV7191611.1 DUF4873 domain-containing protein [Mycolicibacterium brumae]PIB76913.1 DUF4873 domain-containing protein [Mycolicibacterium brumae]RWA20535.1 hypothetical protein MBRU_02435 [Mycolicibacterium brumae DSM 44177]UWW07631.1 DUF4873 domain-containing protein [Mycolicibacterium brumae]